jgi:transposase
MARRCGRGHGRTTTCIAGLRQNRIVAPLALDGPMTGSAFRADVEQVPAPALAPGDGVVMADLATHPVGAADIPPVDPAAGRMVDGVRQAIARAGASTLHRPAHSPDPNPIEQQFAKLEALLRQAEARATDALRTAIGHPLASLPATACGPDLRNCGYGST